MIVKNNSSGFSSSEHRQLVNVKLEVNISVTLNCHIKIHSSVTLIITGGSRFVRPKYAQHLGLPQHFVFIYMFIHFITFLFKC